MGLAGITVPQFKMAGWRTREHSVSFFRVGWSEVRERATGVLLQRCSNSDNSISSPTACPHPRPGVYTERERCFKFTAQRRNIQVHISTLHRIRGAMRRRGRVAETPPGPGSSGVVFVSFYSARGLYQLARRAV